MDSHHASEKSVKEKINKKDDKRSSVDLHSGWLTLLGSLALLSGSQSLDIKGELHKDVLLPCIVVYKDEFNYSLLVVNWQRPENDTLVHTFFHGFSHPEYQDSHYQARTQIFYESLPNGNASLLLRNLTKSDAGSYICHVVLKQSSGYLTKYVNLTVDDMHIAEMKNWTLIVAVPVMALAMVMVAVLLACYKYWTNKGRTKDEEAKRLIEDKPDPIKKYRKDMEPKMTDCKDLFDRQLLVVEGSLFPTSELDNISFRDQQKNMNVKELFTIENQHRMSRRMLLVGDVGTGKSYFCKWLEMEWVKKGNTLYQCITYVSGKKINKNDEKTSVKNILEQKCKDLSDVLHMSGVLLILDELDDLVHDANITYTDLPFDKDNNLDIDTLLPLNTLIENIINKQLLPETDVLIVSRRDSPISKLPKLCKSTFVLQEFNGVEAYNVYDTVGHLPADSYKSMKDISYNPAFVFMFCNFNRFAKKVQFISPYELVIFFLQQCLKELYGEGGHVEEQIRQLAKESYQNLIKGEQNKIESTSQWKHFLNFFKTSPCKYQCKCLRDMLAALYCVWQLKMGESLQDCLDFWLFGAHIERKHTCPLLSPVAEEHHAKYYNFIRFFMRLLPYPDYNSLCNNTPNLDDNLRKLLRDYFKNILKDHNENYDKLAVVHCVFELQDDYVTKAFSSIEHFSLVNTPLNSLDIRSIVYCFKDIKLQKFDLRLCALTGEYVKQLKNIIKNTGYVLLSSNRLTSETGTFLGELLQEPECLIEKLALGTNNLGPNGARALWRALEHNRSLRSLYLYDNNIGEDKTFEMVEHLLKKNSLKELHLCLNHFDAKQIETIKTLKAKKTELKVVVRISEDLELFEYVEKKVEDLFDTWSNYNKEWLNKLLQTVKADLQNKDWDMDAKLTPERVKKLIKQIESIMNIIKKGEIHVRKRKQN